MAKVYGIHALELKPGVDGQAFERYFTRELSPILQQIAGQDMRLLKGDRGSRTGRYLLLIAIDSVARRDQLFPTPGGESGEMDRLFAAHSAVTSRLDDFVVAIPAPDYTDYIVVE